jgi:hypothetical protein
MVEPLNLKKMKIIKYIIACSLMIMMAVSCDKGLDPIVPVNTKPDVSAPEIEITSPENGKTINSLDSVATITIQLLAEDDVELKSVLVTLNEVEIVNMTSFIDYRRLDLEMDQGGILDGVYTLDVVVTDLTDKVVSKSITFSKVTVPPYTAMDGEVLYFSFDGFYLDLISKNEPTVTGFPSFVPGKTNNCLQGATDSYLEYPTTGLLGTEFSVAFWYKVNAIPDRAGIMAISHPVDIAAADRIKGFRLFREISGADQNIGLNIGNGTDEVWMNPFVKVAPDADWIHLAISITSDTATIYVNGELSTLTPKTAIGAPIDWTDCTSMTLGSGMPNFIYWLHYSDLSLYDEFHMFKRAITQDEVKAFYEVKK